MFHNTSMWFLPISIHELLYELALLAMINWATSRNRTVFFFLNRKKGKKFLEVAAFFLNDPV